MASRMVQLRLIPGMEMLHTIELAAGEALPERITMTTWTAERERWELVFELRLLRATRETETPLYEFLTADSRGVEDEVCDLDLQDVRVEGEAGREGVPPGQRGVRDGVASTATVTGYTTATLSFAASDFQWMNTGGTYLGQVRYATTGAAGPFTVETHVARNDAPTLRTVDEVLRESYAPVIMNDLTRATNPWWRSRREPEAER